MQLALDNPKGELMPGGFANVKLSLQRDAAPFHIPASALIFNKDGLRVATVGADDKVLFKTVTIARDLGREIELASGVSAEDRIITAPPDRFVGRRCGSVSHRSAQKPKSPATASERSEDPEGPVISRFSVTTTSPDTRKMVGSGTERDAGVTHPSDSNSRSCRARGGGGFAAWSSRRATV